MQNEPNLPLTRCRVSEVKFLPLLPSPSDARERRMIVVRSDNLTRIHFIWLGFNWLLARSLVASWGGKWTWVEVESAELTESSYDKEWKIEHHFPLLILHSCFTAAFCQTYCVPSKPEDSNQLIFSPRSACAGISCSLCRARMRNGDPRQQEEAVLWSIWSFGLSLLLFEIRLLHQNSNNNMKRWAHKSIDGSCLRLKNQKQFWENWLRARQARRSVFTRGGKPSTDTLGEATRRRVRLTCTGHFKKVCFSVFVCLLGISFTCKQRHGFT